MRLEAGQLIDQYRLVEVIGEGGMGVVWKARDTSLDRDVAIKVLPAAVVGDATRLARFEREAKAVAGTVERRPASSQLTWWLGPLVAAGAFGGGWLLRPAPPPAEPARVTQLTFTGADYQPAVSPDGSRLAISTIRQVRSLNQADGLGPLR